MKTSKFDELIVVGWREWVQIPELNLSSIKVKVDTGAKTSALHAKNIEPFFEKGIQWVKFEVFPFQHDKEHQVKCIARVVDRRFVSDSGGHREKRYVIRSHLVLGKYILPCEITLTNRESMQFRMLLGREALENRMLVDTGKSFLWGKPELEVSKQSKGKSHHIHRHPHQPKGKFK
ncbi:MAG: ATP-dependent zinc protease [Pseudobdellovibrionaceae bacterium]